MQAYRMDRARTGRGAVLQSSAMRAAAKLNFEKALAHSRRERANCVNARVRVFFRARSDAHVCNKVRLINGGLRCNCLLAEGNAKLAL